MNLVRTSADAPAKAAVGRAACGAHHHIGQGLEARLGEPTNTVATRNRISEALADDLARPTR